MRIDVSRNVDPGTLADQLTATLGRPIAVTLRVRTGQQDPAVKEVVLVDPFTGDELPDQDPAKVAAVIAAHVIPPPPVTPAAALVNALGSAANVADIKAALATFAGAVVAQETQARQGRGQGGRGGGQGGGS